jgi:hypothetical protein
MPVVKLAQIMREAVLPILQELQLVVDYKIT